MEMRHKKRQTISCKVCLMLAVALFSTSNWRRMCMMRGREGGRERERERGRREEGEGQKGGRDGGRARGRAQV